MSEKETRRQLREKIKDIRFGMLTTLDEDGALVSRPMTTQQVEEDGTLWFFGSSETDPVREIRRHDEVNVCYADPDDNRYVSVSGSAEVMRDRAKAKELWSPMAKAWFPEGVDDPRLILIKVEPRRAEYWDSASSKMVTLFAFAKAVIAGRRLEPGEVGEHRKIEKPNLDEAVKPDLGAFEEFEEKTGQGSGKVASKEARPGRD